MSILKNVKTWRFSEKKSLKYVIDNLAKLVVKEVHGSGGYGMLIGPTSSKKEIENFNAKNLVKLEVLNEIDLFNDFLSIASLLKNLDLFITVSNSTAHLAGALNVKTILLKPFNQATFFYWNQYTNKTPWYSSIHLIDIEKVKNKKQFINLVYDKIN